MAYFIISFLFLAFYISILCILRDKRLSRYLRVSKLKEDEMNSISDDEKNSFIKFMTVFNTNKLKDEATHYRNQSVFLLFTLLTAVASLYGFIHGYNQTEFELSDYYFAVVLLDVSFFCYFYYERAYIFYLRALYKNTSIA